MALGLPLVAGAPNAWAGGALPANGHYVAGTGAIAKKGLNGLAINQNSNTGIIDWSSFSIGKGNKVQFNNGAGATLNRVTGGDLSTIAGSLKATGSLYLINPQGVIVSGTGKVVTGGSFVASSRDESDTDFLSGKRKFSGSSDGKVSNAGTIKSANGDVALIGSSVSNSGSLSAANGTASLNAGNQVLLAPAGSRILVSGGMGSASNSGTLAAAQAQINAAGGNVYALAGNNGGIVRASGTQTINGHVWLTSGTGNVTTSGKVVATNADGSGGAVTVRANNIVVSGNVDASARKSTKLGGDVSIIAADTTDFSGTIAAKGGDHGKGGFVETSGQHLHVAGGAKVDTLTADGLSGDWLIDPNDFTIAASGGDITGAQLSTNLGTTDVTIASGDGAHAGNGDIFVNDAVSWSSTHSLTLNAQRNIDVNANVTISGSGALNLNTGLGGSGNLDFTLSLGRIAFTNVASGNNTALTINSQAYTLENTVSDLDTDMQADSRGFYALANNYNAAGDGIYSGPPIDVAFAGTFEGLGNSISNLSSDGGAGLISAIGDLTTPGYVRDLQIERIAFSFTGDSSVVGGLTDAVNRGEISNVAIGGTIKVSGSLVAGGLVGLVTDNGVVKNSSSSVVIEAEDVHNGGVGGLIGVNRGSISGSYATGAISSKGDNNAIGGLVGTLGAGSITSSYASGDIYTDGEGVVVGGFVGLATAGTTIDHAYATGNVDGESGSAIAGGFVGNNLAAISNAYSTGNVSVGITRGGFVGLNNGGSIKVSYETGQVGEGGSVSGGFAGQNNATLGGIVADYYNETANGGFGVGAATPGAINDVVGLARTEMQSSFNFVDWNFNTVTPGDSGWVIIDTDGSLDNDTADGATTPMLLTEYSKYISNAHQLQLMDLDPSFSDYTLIADIDAIGTQSHGDVWGTSGFIAVGGPGVFAGVFDGQGHTVSNLFIDSNSSNVGLFSGITGTVKNVGLLDANINGSVNLGGLAGFADGAQISNVFVTGSITGTSGNIGGLIGTLQSGSALSNSWSDVGIFGDADNSGGLAGFVDSAASITQSHADGFVFTSGFVGGLAGQNDGTISFSYAAGRGLESTDSYAGGIAGRNTGTITDVYSSEDVFAAQMGGLVGDNSGSISNSFWNTDAVSSSGVTAFAANSGTSSNNSGLSQADMGNPSNFTGWTFGGLGSGANWVLIGADGSVNNTGNAIGGTLPMLLSEYSTGIRNAHQLQLMTLDLAQSYTLENDIGALGTNGQGGVWGQDGFIAVGGNNDSDTPFSGTFDGQGHTISRLWIADSANAYAGLFGTTSADAVIEDVSLENLTASHTNTADVPNGIGGLVGYNNGLISNVSVSGSISVSGIGSTGGIVGYNKGSIAGAQSAADVAVLDDFDDQQGVGGLVGFNFGDISDSSASGSINSNASDAAAGGLVGFNTAVGGTGHISSSSATGAVSGAAIVGGLVGTHDSGLIESSFATGEVVGSGTDTGGLAGLVGADATVETSYASGAVLDIGVSDVAAGGLVGDNEGTISQSYAAGNVVSAFDGLVGGFVGVNNGSIDNSYAMGNILANNAGGFVGQNNGDITAAYSLGVVNGDNTGGFAGANSGTVQDSYWDVETSGLSSDFSTAIGETSAQLKSALSSGFDSSVWGILDGKSFAYLKWQFGDSAPTAISGTLYSDQGATAAGAGLQILLYGEGGDLGDVVTFADGSFYKLIADSQPTGVMATNFEGAAYSDNGDYTGMDIYGSGLRISTADTEFSTLLKNIAATADVGSSFSQIAQSFGRGNVTIAASAANFDIDDELDAGVHDLTLNASGSISESGSGLIGANVFAGSSQGEAVFDGQNTIAELAAFDTDDSAFAFRNIFSFTVTGHVDAGSAALSLTSLGDLSVNSILEGGDVTLQSAGINSESAAGGIIAASLSSSSAGNAVLTSGHNQIGTLSEISTSGFAFSLTNAGTLRVEGAVNAGIGAVTLTTIGSGSELQLNSQLTGGTVTLNSADAITEETDGVISASTLTGSSVGAVDMRNANTIAALGGFTTHNGNFSLISAETLNISGSVNAGTGTLSLTTAGSGSSLLLHGTVTGGTVTLKSANAITEGTGGLIHANALTGSAVMAVALTGANTIANLGAFTTSNAAFTLKNSGTLNVAETVDIGKGALTLNAAGSGSALLVRNKLKASTVTLKSAGAITEGTSALINTTTLTGSSVGATSLKSAKNIVAKLDSFTTGNGAFALTDAAALVTVGTVNAGTGSITLTTTGAGHNLAIRSQLANKGSASVITLTSAGNVSETTAGAITTHKLNVKAQTGITLTSPANNIATLGTHTTASGPNNITL